MASLPPAGERLVFEQDRVMELQLAKEYLPESTAGGASLIGLKG